MMLELARPLPRPLVAPSILSADFGRMEAECREVLSGGADLLHVDVMDGHFVPNLTMGPDMVRALRRHFPDVFLDVHLMVERPDLFVDAFADAGANLLSFHVEVCAADGGPGSDRPGAMLKAGEVVDRIHARGLLAGIAVNPPTPGPAWRAVVEQVLERVELVLVMSVNPGRSGQRFMPEVLEKAGWIRERLRPEQRLEIDGGINEQTAAPARDAGCDVLVAASAIFGAGDRAGAIRRLRGTSGAA